MGQCGVRASTPAALCAAFLLAIAAVTRPRPLPDRLVAIPANETRIDIVKPFNAVEKWAANGSQAGLHRLNPARVAHFDKRIRSLMRPPFRVLDAGCGGGLVANALGGLPGYAVEGVDMSPQALQFAQETADRVNLTSVTFRNASIYNLPFRNESFDVVIISDVLEHLLDLMAALAEAARVLRPGGVLLFDTIDRTWSSYLVAIVGAERLVGLVDRGSHDWSLFIRPRELKRGLERTGFHSFSYESFDPSVRSLLELSLFSAGLLRPESMRGGWSIGSPNFVMVSYIGQAVKNGAPKAAARHAAVSSTSRAPSTPEAVAKPAARRELSVVSSPPAPATVESSSPMAPAAEKAATAPLAPRQVEATTAPPATTQVQVTTTAPPAKAQTKATTSPLMRAREEVTTAPPAKTTAKVTTAPPAKTTAKVTTAPPAETTAKAKATPVVKHRYKVGQEIQLRVSGGGPRASWVRARVRGLAARPETYWLHVPAMPKGQQDLEWTVPASSLRSLEAAEMAFKVNDNVEVKAEAGPKNGTWVKAVVVALGTLSDTYDIRLSSIAGGTQVQGVPADKLRKVVKFEAGERAEIRSVGGSWAPCNVTGRGKLPDTYDIRVPVAREPGYHTILDVPMNFLRKRKVSAQEAAALKAQEAWARAEGDFRAGERCLVIEGGNWTPCTVTGKGKLPDTYDILVKGAASGNHSSMRGVAVKLLASAEAATKDFKVGEMASVKVFKGKSMGSWVSCVVVAGNKDHSRYDIRVKSSKPPGYLDVRNVSAIALRREASASDTMPEWAIKASSGLAKTEAVIVAAKATFKAGESALVRVSGGPKAGSWTQCTILGKGVKPDTYDIRVGTATPPHHIDLLSIPASAIRKAERLPSFEAGAQAEIQVHRGPLSGSWVRCVVLSKGKKPDTYDILTLLAKPLAFSDIPAIALRQPTQASSPLPSPPPLPAPQPPDVPDKFAALDAPAEPVEAPVPVFQAGETAEVRSAEGWLRCIVGEKGRVRNSYNIRVVADNTEGFLDVPNVPVHKLRKNARPNTFSIIMWILEILLSQR